MKIKLIGSNQTELYKNNGDIVFFSYETPVAIYLSGKGYFRTSKKFSNTTTRHINKWLPVKATERTQEEIEAMI